MKDVIKGIQHRQHLKYLEENENQLFESLADFGDKKFIEEDAPAVNT